MHGDENGIKFLVQNLSHYDHAIIIFSAEVLARTGNTAPLQLFRNELKSRDPYERIHGAVYLAVLGDGSGLGVIDEALKMPHDPLGQYTLTLLSVTYLTSL